jgi:hypothetical protein
VEGSRRVLISCVSGGSEGPTDKNSGSTSEPGTNSKSGV